MTSPRDDDTGAETGLDGSEWSFTTDIEVRYRDLDAMNHVNNAVYLTYLETAVARYYETVIGRGLHEESTALVSLDVEFDRPIHYGDDVTVAMCIHAIGTTSLSMAYELRVGESVAATARSVQVVLDDESGRPRPIPDAWRGRITAHEGDGVE